MNRKCMVLAAGFGKRMQPFTASVPKPLVMVGGKTLIDRNLDWLAESGVNEAIVNTHHKAEMLEAHLAKRTRPHISISREQEILETGGGIKNALPLIGSEPFFCINSDVICLDGEMPALQRLEQAWDSDQMDALLLIHPVREAIGFSGPGDFFLEQGQLRRRLEEPTAPFVYTGIQMLHPRIFKNTPDGAFSLNLLYNRDMTDTGELKRVCALVHDGAWLHVGDPEGVRLAEAELA
jgi:N-acetyl-alpha-D-muramate 1-phosphate uridylyltransferase